MKKIFSILLSLLIISSTLSSIEITLINDEMISGVQLHNLSKKEIYIEIDNTLLVINKNAILTDNNNNFSDYSINDSTDTINYNSYQNIYQIDKNNIWNNAFFSNLRKNSFIIEERVMKLKFLSSIKIETINGKIFKGRFFGDSQQELKLVDNSLLFIPKNKIERIWSFSNYRKNGSYLGGSIGLILGVSVGSGVAQQFGDYDDREKPNSFLPTVVGMIAGPLVGIGIGYLIGVILDNEKIVWSRN